jgi:hypothetical protein
MVHREDLVSAGAFDPDIYPEDYDLCFRFYKQGLKPVAVPGILHYWRDHPERVSRNNPEYADQQFFDLKLKYFFELERDQSRELIIWGTGAKGKKLTKKINDSYEKNFRWITGNPKKIGEKIYGVTVEETAVLGKVSNPQIIVAVSSPKDIEEIEKYFKSSELVKNREYFFFC